MSNVYDLFYLFLSNVLYDFSNVPPDGGFDLNLSQICMNHHSGVAKREKSSLGKASAGTALSSQSARDTQRKVRYLFVIQHETL